MENESRERPGPARGLPSRKKLAAMTASDQWRVIEDWLRRARKTVRDIVREVRRIRTLAGPYTLCSLEGQRRPPLDLVRPLLALEREWDRCRRSPRPRRRAKHPTPEEIARMGPRQRHFAEWDRARRARIQRKRCLTMLANSRAQIGEELFQRWLNDPDPKYDFVRRAAEAERRAIEERDRPLNN
jgi:hypothetical protein